MITLNDLNTLLEKFFRFKLSTTDDDYSIVFYPPLKSNTSTPDNILVNIYLFDIRENVELKINEWEFVQNGSGGFSKKKPPIMLDLFYMLTVHGSDNSLETKINTELDILSNLLPVVYHQSYISQIDVGDELNSFFNQLPDSFHKIPIESIHPKFLDEQNGFQLWSSFDQYVRPAIYLKLTAPIVFDPQDGGSIVLEKTITVHDRHHMTNFVDLEGIVYTKIIKTYTDAPQETIVMPISGAKVILEENIDDTVQMISEMVTNSQGEFSFKLLKDVEKEYQIIIVMSGYEKKSMDIEDLSEKLSIELEKN